MPCPICERRGRVRIPRTAREGSRGFAQATVRRMRTLRNALPPVRAQGGVNPALPMLLHQLAGQLLRLGDLVPRHQAGNGATNFLG